MVIKCMQTLYFKTVRFCNVETYLSLSFFLFFWSAVYEPFMKQQKQNIEEVRAEEELEVPPDLDFNR